VIAAYNCGPGSVNKAIRRSGGKRNFWDIYYYLPRQTRGHVPAFIAATYTMNYYREHNLVPVRIELPIPTDTLMVSEELHLGQVSEVLGLPIDLLRDINPQYKKDIIPGHSRPFSLKLPMEHSLQFIDLRDSIFACRDSVYFNKEVITKSPADYTSSRYLPEPPSKNMTKVSYTVKSGDNLGIIAGWYHVRVSDLKYWNNIYGSMIRSGQQLIVYVPKDKAGQYRKINDMSFAEKQRSVGKEVKEQSTSPRTGSAPLSDEYIYYTIRSGDTLWDIARKYSGVSDTDIMELNNISNAGKIRPGQVIKIKRKG
jgi:membrane-bound lytic murein transglycosylase D